MDVQKWLLWTEHLYKLPQVSTMFQQLSGRDLCSMTEADFKRSSQFGDVLYAHLDIWRSGKNINNGGKRLYTEDRIVRQMQCDQGQIQDYVYSVFNVQPDQSFLFCVFSCSNEGALPTRRQQIW